MRFVRYILLVCLLACPLAMQARLEAADSIIKALQEGSA